jgi:hypothetical protein
MRKFDVIIMLCISIFLVVFVIVANNVHAKTDDLIKKEMWATAYKSFTDDKIVSFFTPESKKKFVKFRYMLVLGDIFWDNDDLERAKVIYARAIKEYYDTNEELDLLIDSSIVLDKIMLDVRKSKIKPQSNSFSNISLTEEEKKIEKIEMPNCRRVEDFLECSIMNATKNNDMLQLTIKAKNISEDIIMKSSEISIIIFSDDKEYVEGSLLRIPRLKPGEEKYLFSSILIEPNFNNITLKFHYKVNYVEIEE